ncbi:hypothetical protein D9M69_391540 [compost metagenome]
MELGLFRVELTLRETTEVIAVARGNRLIVGDGAVTTEGDPVDLLAIEQMLHGEDEIRVLHRAQFVAHHQVGIATGLGLHQGDLGVVQKARNRTRVDRVDQIHVAGQKCADARRLVGNREKLDLVEIRQARLPVAVVALADRTHARLELDAFEWPGAISNAEVRSAVSHDEEVCGAEDGRQVRIRAAQDDLNLVGTNSLHFTDLFGDCQCLGTEFRQLVAVQRIDHIRRGERLAIVEYNVLAQLDGPGDRVAGIERFRQGHAWGQLLVQRGQAVVEHVVATVVGVVPALGRIQGVGGRTGRTGYLDAATTFAFTGASVGAGRS